MKKLFNEMYGLVINDGEKSALHNLCVKYNIPITYPELFSDSTEYNLWGINNDGIGLLGTFMMNKLPKDKIIHGVKELELYIQSKAN
ncbi:MAG: hypothetical protein K5765_05205 [Clostridia bacterium]|nr:hypothetical protein [Clostridia bacterium]